jgi:hypothetical protein
MECFTENRITVITLHKRNKTSVETYYLLKKIKITQKFLYRTIKRYNDWCSGQPRTIWTAAAIKVVREGIRRNLIRKQKIMAWEIKISPGSMSRIIIEGIIA